MKQRLLIIDDTPGIHALIRARLATEPVECLSAENGPRGIAMAMEETPDLILLDVDMPEMDGFEVCRRLKQNPALLSVPVIFLVGAASTDQKLRGLDLGAADYITKPFDPAELRARVRAGLRTKYLLDLLNNKAQIDGLTGLWNRAHFQTQFAIELSRGQRHQFPVSLVMVEVDHFKQTNDTHGHPFGDAVLVQVASALQAGGRKEDVSCRYGGKEFAIILPNADQSGAAIFAKRTRKEIEAIAMSRNGVSVPLSCSFGIATFLPTEGHAETTPAIQSALFECAEAALARAKRAGGNRVEVANANQFAVV